MRWLNYHHLLYFYVAAQEGSITAAARRLHLSQPTLSAQIRRLEEEVGEKLFTRRGRKLVLTDVGQTTFRYADEIFTLGRELTETLRGRPTGKAPWLRVGVANVLPKMVVYRLLEPALHVEGGVRLACVEESVERLLVQLAAHELDVVLTDAPVGSEIAVKAHSHLLGGSGMAVYAASRLARSLEGEFPASLDGAPFLLPSPRTAARRSLEHWLEAAHVHPEVVGEFEDTALLRAFGELGVGAFAMPTAVEAQILGRHDIVRLGLVDGAAERYYAVTVARRLQHPGVQAIAAAARDVLLES